LLDVPFAPPTRTMVLRPTVVESWWSFHDKVGTGLRIAGMNATNVASDERSEARDGVDVGMARRG